MSLTDAAPIHLALSPRESEVLNLLAHGIIDKEVGNRLGISLGTVRVYRKRIHEKLGVRGVVQSMLVAWQFGELDLQAIAEDVLASRATVLPPLDPDAGLG